jgi:hypothetical protein
MTRVLDQVRNTRFLLRCGVIGPPLFVAVFVIEGLTRPDYNPFRSMVSELSLSDWGWQQVADFLTCGTPMLAFVVGLRRVDTSRWAARILTVSALGVLMAGVFVTDPGTAYPAGAPDTLPIGTGTWHGQLHAIAGALVFFSMPLSIGFMAGMVQSTEQPEMVYLFGCYAADRLRWILGQQHNRDARRTAGLFQHVTSITYFTWMSLLARRLARLLPMFVRAGTSGRARHWTRSRVRLRNV